MSAYTNTVCGKVVNTLFKLNKEILTVEDVESALKDTGIDSVDGRQNYTKDNGYLTGGGYLIRCIGGWNLTPNACTTVEITVTVMPGMIAGRVFNKVSESLKQFKGITTIEMEV